MNKSEPKILIVEDDVVFSKMLTSWLTKKGYAAKSASTVAAAKQTIMGELFDMIITDLRLPDSDGILLLQWIKEQFPNSAVIIMTNYADIHSAVSAIKLGAFDYLEKPIRPDELSQKIESALSTTRTNIKPTVSQPISNKIASSDYICGESLVSKQLNDNMMIVAPTNLSVLITGESGTGKEYVAKFIHQNSKRNSKPFVAIDCGAISKELGVSEFFGHLKGAFTSAISDKKGVFESANGGTIFLDEIGNLSLEIQMQLLRAIQERKIRAVGSTTEIAIDVRIIAATNENLIRAIEDGRFREDLYHRINELTIKVPALRERGSDIMLFANEFLHKASCELDKSVTGFSDDATNLIINNTWTGNLRELRNVIRRAVLFCHTNRVDVCDMPDELQSANKERTNNPTPLKRVNERELILSTLESCNGNKSKAAKLLQVDRKTLYNKLKQYNISE